MRTRLFGTIALTALVLSACGGGGGDQDEVADMMIASAEEEGITLDGDCVRDVVGELSDEDAAKIIEAGVDGEPDLSPDAAAVAEDIGSCLDTDALVDQIVAEMGGEEGIDADCLRDVLNEQGPEAIDGGAMFECIDVESIDTGG